MSGAQQQRRLTPRLQRARGFLNVKDAMPVICATEWAHAVCGLQAMALGAWAQLWHARVDVAASVVPPAARDLFLRKRTHGLDLFADRAVARP